MKRKGWLSGMTLGMFFRGRPLNDDIHAFLYPGLFLAQFGLPFAALCRSAAAPIRIRTAFHFSGGSVPFCSHYRILRFLNYYDDRISLVFSASVSVEEVSIIMAARRKTKNATLWTISNWATMQSFQLQQRKFACWDTIPLVPISIPLLSIPITGKTHAGTVACKFTVCGPPKRAFHVNSLVPCKVTGKFTFSGSGRVSIGWDSDTVPKFGEKWWDLPVLQYFQPFVKMVIGVALSVCGP